MPSATTTTDHDEIREWVEARGGSPARVRRTGRRAAGDPGILRIDFPGFSGARTLEHISWDEWFDAFEKNKLAFLYQDNVASGQESRFSKLVARRGMRGASATAGRRTGAKRTTTKRTAAAKPALPRAATKTRGTAKRSTAKRTARTAPTRGTSTRTASPRGTRAPTAPRGPSRKKAAGKKRGSARRG